jgi:hypothetical protein
VLQDRAWDPVNTKLFPKTTAVIKKLEIPTCEVFFAKQVRTLFYTSPTVSPLSTFLAVILELVFKRFCSIFCAVLKFEYVRACAVIGCSMHITVVLLV